MTDLCMTTPLNPLESKSHLVIGLTVTIRRRIEQTRLHLFVICLLVACDEILKRCVRDVTALKFHELSRPEQEKTVDLLRNLVMKLDEAHDQILAKKTKIPFGCRRSLKSMCDQGEKLGDLLESFELALNSDFKQLVDESLSEAGISGRHQLVMHH